MDRDLDGPMIRSLVCDTCWSTVFSPQGWQTVLAGEKVPGRDSSQFSNGYSYKTTWSAIHAAAAKGCNWCRLLTNPKSREDGESQVEVWAACDESSECTPAGEKRLRIVVDSSKSSPAQFYLHERTGAKTVTGYGSHRQYYMYTSQNDNAARFVAARERITDVSSAESYRLALQCLDHCVRTHHGCPPPHTDVFLPDRVIDCSRPKKPRITLTGGSQRGHYVTLSYVWGGPQQLTTTQNIDEYVNEGLDMSKFPRTIQDAVLVTHNIGQQYLWIDALCILQDSAKDKERQLSRMRYIYRNAFLTINAACASSSQEGFLNQHRSQRSFSARIPYRCPDGEIGSVWIAQADNFVPGGTHSYWDELEPVTYRGWCLQEKMLPPRSLVYASDTLKFHCQSETVNIGHALCEPSTGRRLPDVIYQPRGPGEKPLSEAEQVAYRQAWLAVIFMYTVREISVPSDKLVALAGIAEQFHLVYNDEYLAGLWRKTLLLDLLWASSIGYRRRRPKTVRAPSWSWASVDGIVEAQYLEGKLGLSPSSSPNAAQMQIRQAEILDCQVTLASKEAPFGEVRGGILKLRGFKQEVVLRSHTVTVPSTVSNAGPLQIGSMRADADEDVHGQVFLVPLLWDAVGSCCFGLVMVKASDGEPEFRRIGRFESSAHCANAKWIPGLIEEEMVLV